MKRILFLLFSVVALSGCTKNYYLVTAPMPTDIYSGSDLQQSIATVPENNSYIILGNSAKPYTYFGAVYGYARKPSKAARKTKLSKSAYLNLVFLAGHGYVSREYAAELGASSNSRGNATGSSSGSAARATSSGGTVHVKGYTRKDGTYVRPHTRSAPRRH